MNSDPNGKPPERCHLGCSRGMQRVSFVVRAGMFWAYIASIQDSQPCGVKCGEQLGTSSQAQVLGEIRQDQPPFASWLQVRGQRSQEPEQHLAVRIIDPALDW